MPTELRWPNWIGVVASDLEAQRRFYRDVLGLKELDAGEDWVQFDMGWPNVLEILRRSEAPQYEQPRYQVGFAVEDIRGVRQRLIEQGVETVTDVEGSPEVGGRWSYFRDPEGNVFEISERLGEPWS